MDTSSCRPLLFAFIPTWEKNSYMNCNELLKFEKYRIESQTEILSLVIQQMALTSDLKRSRRSLSEQILSAVIF